MLDSEAFDFITLKLYKISRSCFLTRFVKRSNLPAISHEFFSRCMPRLADSFPLEDFPKGLKQDL